MSQDTPHGPHQQWPGQPPSGGWPQGPGPQYPYGPPPQRKKRHLGRWILLGLTGLVALIVIIAVAASGGGGVSTTPSGTGTTARAGGGPSTATAGIGSYFDVQDGSGNTYRVTLDKIIDPAQGADQFTQPDNGNRFVGAVFTILAVSGSPSNEDADTDAAIIGGNGQTYTADFDSIAGYTNFNDGQINVAQGETATGAVTFQVPTGVKVSEVQWTPAGGFGNTVQWSAS
jgi:Domain of unknown function (DUF4352)